MIAHPDDFSVRKIPLLRLTDEKPDKPESRPKTSIPAGFSLTVNAPLGMGGFVVTVSPAASSGQVAEPAPVAGRIETARREAAGIEQAMTAWDSELQRLGSRDRPRKLARVRRVIQGIEAKFPDDLSRSAILTHLAARRVGSPKDDEEPIKAKTHDLILGDLRGFLGLCKSHGWVSSNAAEDIPLLGRGVHEDPNDTGAFLYDEYLRLVAAAQADEAAPEPRFGFVRSPAYAIMWHAGLRIGEAIQLQWHDFVFGREPSIRCRAAASKNAKLIWLPLHPDAAAIVQAFRPPTAAPGDRLWSVKCHERVLQADMEAAGVPALSRDGLPRSFHAFRKGLATWLAERNVHPSLAQKLLRHSDIRMTMARYTKLQTSQLRDIVTPEAARDEKTSGNVLDPRVDIDDACSAVRDSGEPMIATLHNTALDSAAAGRTMGFASVSGQHPAAADSFAVCGTHARPVSRAGGNAEGGTRTPPRTESPVRGVGDAPSPTALDSLTAAFLASHETLRAVVAARIGGGR